MKETLANLQSVHIRPSGTMDTYCGVSGGSIRIEHYRQNPSAHVDTLSLCPECERLCQA